MGRGRGWGSGGCRAREAEGRRLGGQGSRGACGVGLKVGVAGNSVFTTQKATLTWELGNVKSLLTFKNIDYILVFPFKAL